ncbi:organic radical activating enzyme [Rhizobium sp. SG_E_25_P2]|uniref:radical SAM protein n=1 Tax=Rhizobium sp. SG_E_25_P2 TaxID=2879942 RepID=UPI002475D01C|nr:radical SAM protein [Rhizobium sp. SG_E_25_P2]MDH6264898.1 organic radical activating enzyme [Rhizobium sp. SG_E_25_P2]
MLTFQQAKDPQFMAIRARNLTAALLDRKILTLVIEAASACNLKCTFCDAHSGRAPKFREHAGVMKEETWEKILSDLRVYVAERGPLAMIQFHGNGEPLLNKKIGGMIAKVKAEGFALKTRVITNGILLNETKARELIAAGLDEIHISVDTLDRDKYNTVKVGDFAERVAANLRAVIPVVEAEGKTELYIKYFAAEEDNSYGITQADSDSVFNEFAEAARKSNVVHLKQQPLVDVGKGMLDGKDGMAAPCEIPFYLLYVMHNGKVSACCSDVFNGLTVGHLMEELPPTKAHLGGSILEVVDSVALYEIRRKHLNGGCNDIKLCAGCGNRTAVDVSQLPADIRRQLDAAIVPPTAAQAAE